MDIRKLVMEGLDRGQRKRTDRREVILSLLQRTKESKCMTMAKEERPLKYECEICGKKFSCRGKKVMCRGSHDVEELLFYVKEVKEVKE